MEGIGSVYHCFSLSWDSRAFDMQIIFSLYIFVITVVAVTVCFLISVLFPVNYSYLSL